MIDDASNTVVARAAARRASPLDPLRPRRELDRRLRLAPGGELARGAARPGRAPPDIRALLEEENAYADAALAPTADLQTTLVAEMRARLQEDDSQPPQADGPWAYYSRFRPGGQHRILCRRPRDGGEEAILIDGDALAAGKAFFSLAAARHAPDHAKLAWGADELGSELLTIRVRDLATGRGPRRPRRQRRPRHRLDA